MNTVNLFYLLILLNYYNFSNLLEFSYHEHYYFDLIYELLFFSFQD